MTVNISFWTKIFSYIYSIPIYSSQKSNLPFEISYYKGKYILNTKHANQSNGTLYHAFHQLFLDQKLYKQTYSNLLVLGFGLGSVYELLKNNIQGKTIGIENNNEIIEFYSSYVSHNKVELIHSDVLVVPKEPFFDLIILDVFEDDMIPEKIEKIDFIKKLIDQLSPNGLLIWNRFYHKLGKSELVQLFDIEVETIYSNYFYIKKSPIK